MIFWPAQACWADTQVEGQHAGPHQLCHPLRLSPPPSKTGDLLNFQAPLEDGGFAHLPGLPPWKTDDWLIFQPPSPLEDRRFAYLPGPSLKTGDLLIFQPPPEITSSQITASTLFANHRSSLSDTGMLLS